MPDVSQRRHVVLTDLEYDVVQPQALLVRRSVLVDRVDVQRLRRRGFAERVGGRALDERKPQKRFALAQRRRLEQRQSFSVGDLVAFLLKLFVEVGPQACLRSEYRLSFVSLRYFHSLPL